MIFMMAAAVMTMSIIGSMMSAGMSFTMFPALNICVILQFSIHIIPDRLIRVSGDAAKESDILSSKVLLRTCADSAADQCAYAKLRQNISKLAMTFSIGAFYLAFNNFSFLNVVDFKCLCPSKMLENRTVVHIICCCNFHCYSSSPDDSVFMRCMRPLQPGSRLREHPARHPLPLRPQFLGQAEPCAVSANARSSRPSS